MVGISDLVAEAQRAGLSLRVDGGRLVIRGPKRFADVAQRLLERKADVLAALQAWGKTSSPCSPSSPPPPPAEGRRCPDCGGRLDQKARCWTCCERLCSQCGKATGSAFIELCLHCGRSEGAEPDESRPPLNPTGQEANHDKQ
jgi:hypothetical protein